MTKQFPARPDYLTNTHIWSVEKHHVTSDDDRMFYDVEDRAPTAAVGECPDCGGPSEFTGKRKTCWACSRREEVER